MTIETTKQPYEFLARWDKGGKLVGAHVQWRYVIRDGDKIIGESVTGAKAVTLKDGTPGFPLADILSDMHIAALAGLNEATAKIAELEDLALQANVKA